MKRLIQMLIISLALAVCALTLAETADETVGDVWIASSSLYYHAKGDCSELDGASASEVTLELAESRGKTACPVCSNGAAAYTYNGFAALYTTTDDDWYHVDPNCQGMTGAIVLTEANAIAAGKTACPVCIGYYAVDGGAWYHCFSNCQGMTGAVLKPQAEWEKMGKTPCPVCMSGMVETKRNRIPAETLVFVDFDNGYFHVWSECSELDESFSMSEVGISEAVEKGKIACSVCVKPNNVYVFATTDSVYYHTSATCSGMKDASCVTVKLAVSVGKQPCPICSARYLPNCKDQGGAAAVGGVKKRGTVFFGSYEQDNDETNGKEPIEWIVLDINDKGEYLLLSKYGLDALPFDSELVTTTWEKASIRSWLNREFFNAAFDFEEQTRIAVTSVKADTFDFYDVDLGSDTEDKVFLLSIDETRGYFEMLDLSRRCVPTDYALSHGADTLDDYSENGRPTSPWWLRSPGCKWYRFADVSYAGSVDDYGSLIINAGLCVRPALWVRLL